MSSGEFFGMVADDPNEKIKLKTFHCEIVNDHDALINEKEFPFIKEINSETIYENYRQIKNEVNNVIKNEIEGLMNSI